ncbi:MAG: ROK family transcriptional regulator [Phyllobacteriaceae bacterium]|nr:ROK family transcriptional regulator [Phyllobacteriaceae bacterium]
MRAYNERLVLTLVRRHGALAKADIARLTRLSAQTVSVIMRSLEQDGLLERGEPQRGRVGQPSVPMSLAADGAFFFGVKIGRRSADLVLMDFVGAVRGSLHETFSWPSVGGILDFIGRGVATLSAALPADRLPRIAGIGVATPFELWNWAKEVGAPIGAMDEWRHVDLAADIGAILPFPVYLENDATAACGAELVFGRGAEFADFLYLFLGAFIGGGVVLDHALYPGRSGNAGAIGTMPVPGPDRRPVQLIDAASVVILERMLRAQGIDPSPLWRGPEGWAGFGETLDRWIAESAKSIAFAVVAACSVIDFSAAIIDGGFPAEVRDRLVAAVECEMNAMDLQGIEPPQIVAGAVGPDARAIGGASLPLFRRFLLDRSVLFKEHANA